MSEATTRKEVPHQGPWVACETRFGWTEGIRFNTVSVPELFKKPYRGPYSTNLTSVYFKTQSGNIYRVDEVGELINARESERRGSVVSTFLSSQELEKAALTVGKYFVYGQGNATTDIVEIVAAGEKIYADFNALKETCGGRTSSIVKEFENMVLKEHPFIELSPGVRRVERSLSSFKPSTQ